MFENFPFVAGSDVILETLESWDKENYEYVGINPSVKRRSPPGVEGRLRVADLDKDGFPDIVITLDFLNLNTDTNTSRTVILTNLPVSSDENDTSNRKIGQIKKSDSSNPLSQVIKTAGDSGELITFIDLDEDGNLDMIV